MAPSQLDAILADTARAAEVVVIESAMGLFDGVPAEPRGFMTHDPAVTIAGVVLNRVGSERHRDRVMEAIAALPLPVLGSIRRDASIGLPQRHLGLVQAAEQTDLAELLCHLAELGERALDVEAIVAIAGRLSLPAASLTGLPAPGRRIALAWDAAFSFVYAHVVAGWRAAGAEVVEFSPLANEAPPDDCDACWLPGGYPERHAARLAAAEGFRAGMRHFCRDPTGPRRVRRIHGVRHSFGGHRRAVACHAGTAWACHQLRRRKLHLGYREATLLANGLLGPAGTMLRGHEFHYANIIDAGEDPALARLFDAAGRDLGPAGGRRGHVSGSFFHAIAPVPTNPRCP
jgi:cobyrinic acid a,c-diamide synthase